MLFLIIWIALVMWFLAKKESANHSEKARIKQMIQESRYREAHPALKRSAKLMNAGYYRG